jgi:ELWxxDGT repeat protein
MALLYFDRRVGGIHQLWVSDGTSVGANLVASLGGGPIVNLRAIGSRVFFTLDDGAHGQELWTSDGTASGTVLVKDINPGLSSSSPFVLTNVGGTLYFRADDGTRGQELWKSDGTAAGTVMVKDIKPGASGSFPFNLANVNGALYFEADDGVHGDELWKSTGPPPEPSWSQTSSLARTAPSPPILRTSTACFTSKPMTEFMALSCGNRTGPPPERRW